MRPAVALVRAQLWAEFGEGADAARAAVLAASDERETCSDLRVAEVLVVGDGDLLVLNDFALAVNG